MSLWGNPKRFDTEKYREKKAIQKQFGSSVEDGFKLNALNWLDGGLLWQYCGSEQEDACVDGTKCMDLSDSLVFF